ncbi:nuclear transport factor 2 family protein [Streptoalloteichus hindustanus]|nr:nuclear transport factor 2 family protein [Streptoalloteichus hindustanus]
MSPRRFVEAMLRDVLLGGIEDVEEAVSTYFAPHYEQYVDGNRLDRAEFARHVRTVRDTLRGGEIEVREVLFDGVTLAETHTVRGRKTDGAAVVLEVYTFCEIGHDGRVRRLKELTHLLTGGPADRALSHVH